MTSLVKSQAEIGLRFLLFVSNKEVLGLVSEVAVEPFQEMGLVIDPFRPSVFGSRFDHQIDDDSETLRLGQKTLRLKQGHDRVRISVDDEDGRRLLTQMIDGGHGTAENLTPFGGFGFRTEGRFPTQLFSDSDGFVA